MKISAILNHVMLSISHRTRSHDRSPIPVFLCLGIAVLCALFIHGIETSALIHEEESPLPISILVTLSLPEGMTGDTLSCQITPIRTQEGWTLFLPGFATGDSLTVTYLGHGTLYVPDDSHCGSGEHLHPMWDEDGIYELTEETGASCAVSTWKLQILHGGAVGSVFAALDLPSLPGLRMESSTGDPLSKVIDWINDAKEHETSARLILTDEEGRRIWSGSVDQFKARGNSSFREITNGRKSYSLLLKKSAGLIDPARPVKKWALIADREQTGLNEYYALNTFDALCAQGEAASAPCDYVDLFIDGEYRGLYLLTPRADEGGAVSLPDWHYLEDGGEQVTVRSDAEPLPAYTYTSALTLTESGKRFEKGGFLLEVTLVETDDNWFQTHNGIRYRIKYPAYCTREQVCLIGTYLQDFEDAVLSSSGFNDKGRYYADYVSLDNLADFLLTYAWFSNQELMRTSTFLYTQVEDGGCTKLTFGPVWDFETVPVHFTGALFDEMCFYDTPAQYLLVEALWTKNDFMQAAAGSARRISSLMEQALTQTAYGDNIDRKCQALLPSLRMDLIRYAGEDTAYQKYQQGSAEALLEEYANLFRDREQTWLTLWDAEVYNLGDPDGHETRTGRNNAYSEEATGEVFSQKLVTILPAPSGETP